MVIRIVSDAVMVYCPMVDEMSVDLYETIGPRRLCRGGRRQGGGPGNEKVKGEALTPPGGRFNNGSIK
jgi:hypothetical protein